MRKDDCRIKLETKLVFFIAKRHVHERNPSCRFETRLHFRLGPPERLFGQGQAGTGPEVSFLLPPTALSDGLQEVPGHLQRLPDDEEPGRAQEKTFRFSGPKPRKKMKIVEM